ncbi:ATP-binding protein, partial [Candidatus Parcubacteria bacterium]
ASSNLKDAYLSVINLLITTSLAGIKPRAFLHIEKLLSSSAALSDTIYTDPKPTYEALSEHFHLPLMILYANRMYGKKIDLCIDDELLLNTQVSIPHPQIIQSVFYNLITNALIYGGGDRIIVRITRSMLDSHESLKVAVDGLINPLPDDVVEKVMSDDHKDSFVKSSSKELGGFGLLLTKKAIEHLGGRLVLTPGSASTFFEFPIKIERLRSDHLTHQQIYVAGNPSAEDLALLKLYMALKRGVALSTAMIVGADYAASTQVGSSAIYVLDNKTLKLISAGAAKNRFVYVTFSHEEYFSLRDTLPSNIEVQCASFGFLELISGISNLDGFLDGITSAASS